MRPWNLSVPRTPIVTVWTLISALLATAPAPCHALQKGDPAPDFTLPWLSQEGEVSATDLFQAHDLTALVIWNHGCPRCTELALAVGTLADSLRPLGVGLHVIVFGPDDRKALQELLGNKGVTVPHLWDADGSVAAAYGLGQLHLSSFLIDRSFVVRAAFDDEVPSLPDVILPAVRALSGRSGTSRPDGAAGEIPPQTSVPAIPSARSEHAFTRGAASPFSALRVDARVRIINTEGASDPGNTGGRAQGFFGETLDDGALLLWRYDLRLPMRVARGLEIIPRLRFSNESPEILTQGEDQLSHAAGTISLRGETGSLAATLGAFPLRLSPLLLQRWDRFDAPPLGGVNSCGCGAGISGTSQRSLEVLGPDYTFEGLSGGYTHRYGRLRGFFAIPQWERQVLISAKPEWDQARFRRILDGASLSLGHTGAEDQETALATPFGLALGYVHVGDDVRTLPRDKETMWPTARQEENLALRAGLGPWRGCALEGEQAWSNLTQRSFQQQDPLKPVSSRTKDRSRAHRFGARSQIPVNRVILWAQATHIQTDRYYEPLYRAMTYDPNRRGWRLSGGIRFYHRPGEKNERLGLVGFYRSLREKETELLADTLRLGPEVYTVAGITLFGRPLSHLAAEAHWVQTGTEYPSYPPPLTQPADRNTRGFSFSLRWEGWPAIDPVLRIDLIRPPGATSTSSDSGGGTVFQGSFWFRVLL